MKQSINSKIGECARVVIYWSKRSEQTASSSAKVFYEAMLNHLSCAKDDGVDITEKVMQKVERAKKAYGKFEVVV